MGFLNLIALGYLSLISLVVLIYFFSRKKTVVEVPSIIPWKVLREDIVQSRLFRIDILFLLQILLLLLLTFFLARPFLKSSIINISGKNIILVIDSSASMQTTESDGTRFDQARSQSLSMVNKMSRWDRMMVITTDYSSVIVSDFTKDKIKLNKAINNLAPRDTGTNLEEGISLGISFLKNVQRGELYVLTDQSPNSVNMDKRKWENMRFLRYGKNSDNVAITSLDVYQDMFKDYTEREVYVTTKNYSDGNKSIKLKASLNNEYIEEKEFELEGGEQKTVKIGNITASGVLKAEIYTDDFLSVDNSAYAIINEIKPINILLVSNDNKLRNELEKIQNTTRRIKLTTIDGAVYEREGVKDYDVVVFHKFVPNINPGIGSLYIFPQTKTLHNQAKVDESDAGFESLLFSNMKSMRNVKIVDWDNTHPTMEHLVNLYETDIVEGLGMDLPGWATSIMKITDGHSDFPIAYAGTYKGKRIIALGFDLGNFDFSKSDSLEMLIMTLNFIQWLNPYEVEGQNKILTSGQYVPNYEIMEDVKIVNPKGETLKYKFGEDTGKQFVFDKIDYTGEYVISGADIKGKFVANFFDAKESKIKPEASGDREYKFESKRAVTSIEDIKNEFGKYLLLLVLFLLVVEWMLFYKKLRTGKA